MIIDTKPHISSIKREQREQVLCSLQGKAKLEKQDRDAGHEYVPMDVYINPEDTEAHFHAASISERLVVVERFDH